MTELKEATTPAQTCPSNARTIVATSDGVEIAIEDCPKFPEFRCIVVKTPHSTYRFGDYPVAEALETANQIAGEREAWQPTREDDYWEPTVWQSRHSFRSDLEFWRRGPGGSELCTHQPHGPESYWRMYWGPLPIVCDDGNLDIFDTAFDAMGVLERLAQNGMEGALLD